MQRYFLKFSYVGTRYHGWQQQANTPDTIQEIMNIRYSSILGEKVHLIGCGRTDSGVHAREFYAHFEIANTDLLADEELWMYKFNVVLPHDISVHQIIPVHEKANARFGATSRTYQYFLHHKKDAFVLDRSYYCPNELDIERMNKAAALLLDHTDFSSFSRSRTQVSNNLCVMMQAEWKKTDNGMVFTIKANRFLRNMVRAIVGTMVDIGKGKLTVEDFSRIIESKDRSAAGSSAPACGLYLVKVEYKEGILN
jgi:tRNA pseudouridine38-40 synthase